MLSEWRVMTRAIEIVEVGPRDGLQSTPTIVDTSVKVELIERLINAGVKRLESASFVNPRVVPAMADAETVMEKVRRRIGIRHIGLALNERGAQRAICSQCDEVNVVLPATAAFGRKNQNASPVEAVKMLHAVAAIGREAGVPVSATISVAFGDPYTGEVDPETVVELARSAQSAGAFEIALADTIGVADPWQVSDMIDRIRAVIGDTPLRLHFHNTRGTALANVHAAVEAGVSVFDASVAGLGGCPFAKSATGNVATEDVVYLLERAGFSTGLDLDALIKTAHWIQEHISDEKPQSMLARAGVFPPRNE